MNYQQFSPQISRMNYDQACAHLMRLLPDAWCAEYRGIAGRASNILSLEDCGFTYLFDFVSGSKAPRIATTATYDDRVVAVYGRAGKSSGGRDAARMQGFLGPTERVFGPGFDKGHFVARSIGGGLDINLFPQRRPLNRGWSLDGKVYVTMEDYCRKQPGAFFFSRPLYRAGDGSWIPAKLEFGVLEYNLKLQVNLFDN